MFENAFGTEITASDHEWGKKGEKKKNGVMRNSKREFHNGGKEERNSPKRGQKRKNDFWRFVIGTSGEREEGGAELPWLNQKKKKLKGASPLRATADAEPREQRNERAPSAWGPQWRKRGREFLAGLEERQ